ncbi:hypothetical protein GCM10009641_54270 [Mycobacterium cookii]|uniref:Uncharacterized protein n=1 Tax=Mycobacterium cookii TaxID=1775 RepID=A0A7I7KRI3_9MYCO|nr:hypothetical protein [Mycobacterium cookii]MCV7332421.1 hypothetical protein [Mycobacterium cookii]BBX44447.1 hypothetical protein MCOO_04620 [Mycobacterium cookii]
MSAGYPYFAGSAATFGGAHPPRAKWDFVLSAVLLTVSLVCWIVAASGGFFVLAFTDFCPAETCHIHQASVSIAVALAVAAAFIVIGAVLAIVRIVRRRLSWPFSAAALTLSIMAELLGFLEYISAVGY